MKQWKLDIITPPDWAKDAVSGLYLYGSRSMAIRDDFLSIDKREFDVVSNIASRIKKSTDYDFATQAPQNPEEKYELTNRLLADGWVLGLNPGYEEGPLLDSLFSKKAHGQSVQIGLLKNYPMFVKAWESIDPAFWYRHMWKSSPDFILSLASKDQQVKHISAMMVTHCNTVNKVYRWKQ